ncbi:hypothetical protein LCGC14_0392680 [marine sediment metagenome]|uniref:Uncharacterized protein n=1 Tax=marine sediment metagenome TaxID=412755 RepID=A0A0F9TH02_9ZZZZ
MTLNELIRDLQLEQDRHGDNEVGYEVGSTYMEILIGDDPATGSSVNIPDPGW